MEIFHPFAVTLNAAPFRYSSQDQLADTSVTMKIHFAKDVLPPMDYVHKMQEAGNATEIPISYKVKLTVRGTPKK